MPDRGGPTTTRLRLGEVVGEAFAIYRQHARVLLAAALIVSVPIGLLDAATHGIGDASPDEVDAATVIAAIGAVTVISITATIGDIFYTGIVAAVVGARRTG